MLLRNILIILFSLIFTTAFSVDKGSISGTVRDKNTGALLEGINVRILTTEFKTVTGPEGQFSIKNIPVGVYQIEFTDVAYQTYVESNVMITTGMERNLIIEVGEVTVDEVIVESSRFQKPLDVNTSYKSLTFEEIRRSPGGFEDIGRVVQTLPGLAVTNDGRNDILVRGGSPSENLFIVDGFQVNNFNHFGSQGATGGPISIINLDFVNKVEFLTGGFSVKHGDRLSSVLEIQLRNGNTEKLFGKINLSGTGLGASIEGPLPFKNQGSWIIAGRRSYLDIIFNASGFSFVPEYTDFQAKINYNINNNNFLEITSFGAIDKVRFNNDTEDNIQNNERILTTNQNSYASGISWKTLFSPRSFAQFTLGRNYVNYFYSKRDSLFNETFRNDSEEGDVTLKLEYFNRFADNTFFSFGSGGQTIKLKYDIDKKPDTTRVIDPQTGERIIIPGALIQKDERTFKGYVYAEVIQNLFHLFKLTAGVRYDYFDYISDKNYFSPRASLSVRITDKSNFSLSYGVFYQSPSYIWLIGNEKNRDLQDIRADHYIAGLEYFPDKSSKITLEGYYKDYKYYPVSSVRPWLILANNAGFDSQNSFGLEPLTSEGTGYSYGAELFFQKALTDNFYGAASFSYGIAKYVALDGVERPSDYDNRYIFNLSGGWLPGKNWEFSLKFRVAGGRPYTPIDPANGNIDYSNYNSERLPVYHRLDVRGEKRFNFTNWSLITYADIQNVYGNQNVFQYRWDPFKKIIETDTNLGILPTIGISAEF